MRPSYLDQQSLNNRSLSAKVKSFQKANMTNSFSKTLQASSQKTMMNHLGLSPISSQYWILDSGATDHIVSSLKKLTCNKNGSMISVLLPNGEKARISSTGSIPLNSHYILHDVLCIPNFKVDLMSISRLTWGLNCSVTFYPYWCILQDLVSRKVISLGKQWSLLLNGTGDR